MLDGNDLVLLMDADSQLSADWIASAVRALQSDRKLGGVCGTYLGVNEKGVLRQLQRNEFVRATRLVPRRAHISMQRCRNSLDNGVVKVLACGVSIPAS